MTHSRSELARSAASHKPERVRGRAPVHQQLEERHSYVPDGHKAYRACGYADDDHSSDAITIGRYDSVWPTNALAYHDRLVNMGGSHLVSRLASEIRAGTFAIEYPDKSVQDVVQDDRDARDTA